MLDVRARAIINQSLIHLESDTEVPNESINFSPEF